MVWVSANRLNQMKNKRGKSRKRENWNDFVYRMPMCWWICTMYNVTATLCAFVNVLRSKRKNKMCVSCVCRLVLLLLLFGKTPTPTLVFFICIHQQQPHRTHRTQEEEEELPTIHGMVSAHLVFTVCYESLLLWFEFPFFIQSYSCWC